MLGKLAAPLVLCFWFTAYSQPVSHAEFEVASLKPNRSGTAPRLTGGPGSADPGMWSCVDCTLFILLGHAYRAFEYQIVAPGWTRSASYDVIAKIPPGTTSEEFAGMLRRLLEERFRMSVRHEKREMAIYELVVAKGGPKFQPAGDAPPLPGPAVDRNGFPNVPGGNGIRYLNARGRIQFQSQSMANFAHYISGEVHRPVVDATGLHGRYAIDVFWSTGKVPTGAREPAPGPTIFEALVRQLGLNLRPRKGSIEVVIVDRADKTPAAN